MKIKIDNKFFFLIIYIIITQCSYSFSQNQPDKYELVIDRVEQANFFIENVIDFEEATRALEYLNTKDPAFLKTATEVEFLSKIKTNLDYALALKTDIEAAIRTGNSKTFLKGETVRQLANSSIDKYFESATGIMGDAFGQKNMGTYGLDEVAKGAALQLRDGHLTIDALTHYLDFANQFTWGVVGYLSGGGHTSAKCYQQLAGIAANKLRDLTLPIFEKVYTSLSGQKNKLIDNYYVIQQRRIHDGLPVNFITDHYTESELKANGLSKSDINQINANALNLNEHRLKAKRDFNLTELEKYNKGNNVVGGVSIDAKITHKSGNLTSLSELLKTKKDSTKSLFWDY